MPSALVIFESIYGNTHAVADAIAEGLEAAFEVEVAPVSDTDARSLTDADLIVVGGPTHMHGLASSMSRKMAVKAAEDEDVKVDESAREDLGLRSWLAKAELGGGRAAAFDTRIDKSPMLTGSAARGIAKRLRRSGREIVADPESFFVEDSEGPLADGELDRAREWGASLSSSWR
jgi:sulfite reductase alpha subunit-like flavoprotein